MCISLYWNYKLNSVSDLSKSKTTTFEYCGFIPIKINSDNITYEGNQIKSIGNITYYYDENGVYAIFKIKLEK